MVWKRVGLGRREREKGSSLGCTLGEMGWKRKVDSNEGEIWLGRRGSGREGMLGGWKRRSGLGRGQLDV